MLGLVTPREVGGGSGSDAAVIRAAAGDPDRMEVLDWVRFSAGPAAGSRGRHPLGAGGGIDGMVTMLKPFLRAKPPERPPWA